MMRSMMRMARFLALCAKLIKGRTLVQKEVVEFTSEPQSGEKRGLSPQNGPPTHFTALTKRETKLHGKDGWINERQLHRWPLRSKKTQKVLNDRV